MSRYAGVVRDHEGLERLLALLEQAPPASSQPDLATVEATSLHAVSVLVAASALARSESRGCHRWADLPATSGQPARHTVLRTVDGQLRLAGPVTAGSLGDAA
jgi:aspartate oxidase